MLFIALHASAQDEFLLSLERSRAWQTRSLSQARQNGCHLIPQRVNIWATCGIPSTDCKLIMTIAPRAVPAIFISLNSAVPVAIKTEVFILLSSKKMRIKMCKSISLPAFRTGLNLGVFSFLGHWEQGAEVIKKSGMRMQKSTGWEAS